MQISWPRLRRRTIPLGIQPQNEIRSGTRREVFRWLLLIVLLVIGQVISAPGWSTLDLRRRVTQIFTPVLGGDSGRYLEGSIGENSAYGSYVAINQLITGIGATATGVILLQMLMAVIAARCLLDLGERFAGRRSGWFAAGWFLLLFQIAQWTRYILTESLFFSLTVIVMWAVLRPWSSVARQAFLLIPMLFVATFTRPNGIVLAGSVATFFVLDRLKSRTKIIWVAGLWVAVVTIQRAVPWFTSHNDGQIFDRFVQGEVFWNQTEFQRTMPPPHGPVRTAWEFLIYVIQNPLESFALSVSRVGWELIQVRAWYADYYNAAIVVAMSVFYVLATLGWHRMRGSSLNRFVWSVTVPASLLIGLTWAIYEGRFAWWFLVVWIPWVGIGADLMRSRLKARMELFRQFAESRIRVRE